jgi:hypothetical protein
MRIHVVFSGKRWKIQPDPAVVRVGESVVWEFETSDSAAASIVWVIYFDNGTPFGKLGSRFSLLTQGAAIQTPVRQVYKHFAIFPGARAGEPGDYKYGIKAEDPLNKLVLGDDDPRLIVRP